MKRRILAAAGALALQCSNAHAASTAEFDHFRSICIAAQGDRSAALALSDQSGWMPVPDELLRRIVGPMKLGEADGRVRSSKVGLSVLIVGAKALGPYPAEACMIAVQGVDPDELKAQARAFAGAPPVPGLSSEESLGFVWKDVDGHREPISQPALERMDKPAAGLKAMFVGPAEGGFATLILLVPNTQPQT